MGNSASLPSLESTGRPFGTERSPIFSLSRHVGGQTRTESPVERLDRDVGAGGRRRSRQKDKDPGQRAQRGKRPEEARGERQAANQPSRRSAEAKGREAQASRRTDTSSTAQSGSSSPIDGQLTQAPPSFHSHLSSKAPVEPSSLTLAAKSELEGTPPEVALAAPDPVFVRDQKPVTTGLASLRGVQAGTAAPGAGRATPGLAQLALAAAPSESRPTATTKKATASEPTPAQEELSQVEKAQRSSQILRQMRLHLHPGMRSATIQLAPADLGRLSIRLRAENGEVHAILRAQSQEALGVLESHLPELEAAFDDQGFEQLTFEFVLDEESSGDPGAWNAGRDVSAELEQRLENDTNPALRGPHTLSDIEVDTYA